ncbi:Cytoplasmic tRNA 2-thiolation protein 2, partial [Linderina macrospora]
MCDSVDQGDMPAPRQARNQRVPGMCIKCKTEKPKVSIRLSLYCKPCFVKAEILKFRTALNKSRQKVNQHGTRLMAAVSGGPTSMAMLKLILDFHSVGSQGKAVSAAFESITVGHVDESALFPGCDDEVRRILQAQNVKVVTARLEDVFDSAEGLELIEKTVSLGAVRDRFVAQVVEQDSSLIPKERLTQLFNGL